MLGQKIDIALIQPPGWSKHNPPLGLALLKSYLGQEGFQCRVFDLNIILYNLRYGIYSGAWELSNGYYAWEKESYVKQMFSFYSYEILNLLHSVLSVQPRFIGLSVHCSSFVSSKLLALKIKQLSPRTKVIFGGPQVADYTGFWKPLLEQEIIDVIVFGEGEESLAQCLSNEAVNTDSPIAGVAYRNDRGRIIKGPARHPITPLDSLPFADFSDFDLKSYFGTNILPTYFSRGCINKCIYCTENKFFPEFRNRSGQRVFDEIIYQLSLYPETKYFRMHDSVSNGNIKELEKLCGLIIKNRIKIRFNLENAVIREEMSYGLYRKLKEAGCDIIGYGLENPSKPLLRLMGKSACLGADFDKVIKEGVQAKITMGINMMFGLPGETDSDYNGQLDFIKRHRDKKKYMIINPALNFCYFPSGCDVHIDPAKYGIDLSNGELYWFEKCGNNDFLKRLDKFERFCAEADKLGYKNIFELTKQINKHELLGSYYYKINQLESALVHFKKSFKDEFASTELIDDILGLYSKLGLPKDSDYEKCILRRRSNADSCREWVDAPQTHEGLTQYLSGLTIEKVASRFDRRAAYPVLPRPEPSFYFLKKLAKYLIMVIFNRNDAKKAFYAFAVRMKKAA